METPSKIALNLEKMLQKSYLFGGWGLDNIGGSRGGAASAHPPNRLGMRFCTSWQQKIPLVILGISIYTCE